MWYTFGVMANVSRAELKYFVERSREEIKTLYEIGRLLTSTTEPQAIIRLAASYAHGAFPVALCGIFFFPQRKLHLIPFAPIAPVELASATRQIREAASDLLKHPIAEEDSLCVMETVEHSGLLQPTASLRSKYFAPLLTVKGEPIGLLSLFSGKEDAFSQEDGHAIGIVAEQLASSLRNAFLVEELRRADELKNQMLSLVSHELSTPLTAIKEGVNLVLDGSLGETSSDQQDFLKTVLENADRLERLIEKIKTSTELMTGQTKFAFESYDLRTLLASLEKIHRQAAAAKGLRLTTIDFPKPLFWQVDLPHLTVALNQLVENAIQATSRDGHVKIKLSAGSGEAVIEVIDTGAGIAKDALPSLFEQFKSIGDLHERKMGGLGQGLFIAKSLIKGHGGAIEVESIPGQGTTMTVRLPKERKAAA
ncbi:MAG: GAF domain-containing sensor histidine kinase [Candidatus Omnitrophica bacterium]|nr:GAF domain-containing sensor histidine kinase [Candidatus Omnitrophota bacterium]